MLLSGSAPRPCGSPFPSCPLLAWAPFTSICVVSLLPTLGLFPALSPLRAHGAGPDPADAPTHPTECIHTLRQLLRLRLAPERLRKSLP